MIAGLLNWKDRKVRVRGLELLKTDDVGLGRRKPSEKIGQPLANVVDVEGRDLERAYFCARARPRSFGVR